MAEDKPDIGAADAAAEKIAEQDEQMLDDAAAESAAQVPDGDGANDALSLEEQIEQLQAELDVARDAALRAQAESQNTKRRADKDIEKARKYALERFCSELLPVADNLERALEATRGDDATLQPIAEGVELTLKSFFDALGKFNIESVNPEGEPFDPNLHQAMSMIENPEVEPNSVIAVMQKGYTLNGRLVRPAMVMVSKAAEG